MADIVGSLFGISTDQLQQQQDLQENAMGLAFARLNDDEALRFVGYKLGGMAAKGVNKLFGVQDPQMKRVSDLEGVLAETQQEVGSDDPLQIYPVLSKKLIDKGFNREALGVQQQFQALKQERIKQDQSNEVALARSEKLYAEAALKNLEYANERAARAELDSLPPDASQEQVIQVLSKYGDPQKMLTSIMRNRRQDKYMSFAEKQQETANKNRIAAEEQKARDAIELEQLRQMNREKLVSQKAQNTKDSKTASPRVNQVVAARGENLMGAVSELSRSLEMITKMPSTVDMGMFGGVKQGDSLFTAPMSATAFALTSEDSRMYQIAASNLGQALATIEFGGFKPNQTAITSYQEKLAFKPGDTPYTKIYALADAKEQAKARAPYSLANPNIPDEQKEILRKAIATLDEIIPFTPEDVSQMRKRGISVEEFMKSKETKITVQKGFTPTPEQEYQISKVIEAIVSGKLGREQGIALLKKKGIKVE